MSTGERIRCAACGKRISVPPSTGGEDGDWRTDRHSGASIGTRSSADASKGPWLFAAIFSVTATAVVVGMIALYVTTSRQPDASLENATASIDGHAGSPVRHRGETRATADRGPGRQRTDAIEPTFEISRPLRPIAKLTGDELVDEYLALVRRDDAVQTDGSANSEYAARSLLRRMMLASRPALAIERGYESAIRELEQARGPLRIYAAEYRARPQDSRHQERRSRWWRWMLDRYVHGVHFGIPIPTDQREELAHRSAVETARSAARAVLRIEGRATPSQITPIVRETEAAIDHAEQVRDERIAAEMYWEYDDAMQTFRHVIDRWMEVNRSVVDRQPRLNTAAKDLLFALRQSRYPRTEEGQTVAQAMDVWIRQGRPPVYRKTDQPWREIEF